MTDATAGHAYYGFAAELAKLVDSLPKWEREKCVRYMLRLKNNCPKVARLTKQFEAGIISREQLLSVM